MEVCSVAGLCPISRLTEEFELKLVDELGNGLMLTLLT